MDRQRIVNLLAAIAAITVFGFTFGLMFPLLSLIQEAQGIPSDIIGYNAALHPIGRCRVPVPGVVGAWPVRWIPRPRMGPCRSPAGLRRQESPAGLCHPA